MLNSVFDGLDKMISGLNSMFDGPHKNSKAAQDLQAQLQAELNQRLAAAYERGFKAGITAAAKKLLKLSEVNLATTISQIHLVPKK